MSIVNNTRVATWDMIGNKMSTTKIDEVLEKANLLYTVSNQSIYTKIGDTEQKINNKFAIVRDSDNHLYNVVSDKYTILQNEQAFDFIKYIDEDIEFVNAGETKSGFIYVIGKLKTFDILGDKFTTYVIFQNSHTAKHSLSMTVCPLRFVCKNQFRLMFKESNNTFTIKHTRNIESKVANAATTLNTVHEYMNIFEAKANEFASTKVSSNQITKFIESMFPITEHTGDLAKNRIELERAKFINAYNHDDNGNFKGSVWGLLNGISDYTTHNESVRKIDDKDEKKFVHSILYDDTLNNAMGIAQKILI